jgi:hypothetical protein
MSRTIRNLITALVAIPAFVLGAVYAYAWYRGDLDVARARRATVPEPPAANVGPQAGAGPDTLITEALREHQAKLGEQRSPLSNGRFVGEIYSVMDLKPDRVILGVETRIDGRPLDDPGWRMVRVAPHTRVGLGTERKTGPRRIGFSLFAHRFNGFGSKAARLQGLRYSIRVEGGRVRSIAEFGPPYSKSLASKDQGKAVQALQRRLAELHYDVGPMDGTFGDDTFHAVVAFQKVNGMKRDGVVTPALWKQLYDPVIPKLRRKGNGPRIEVDITKQVLYLIEDRRVVRIVDISSGGGLQSYADGSQHDASTPTGHFHIFQYIPGWYESSVGPMYESHFFATRIAIHGSMAVPPYPASHGCVRVTVSGMDRLLPELSVGMPVSVYRT